MLGNFLARFVGRATFAGDENVEVANGFAPAPQRPGRRHLLDSRRLHQVRDQLVGQLLGGIEREAAADAPVIFNRLEQFLLVFFAHARQFANLAFARQFFHAVDVANLVGAPDQRNRFWPEALNLEQLKHRRAILFEHLGVDLDIAFAKQVLQVREHAFADAGHRQQFFRGFDERGNLLRQRLDGLGRVAIRANAKRILPVDFEQVGSFVKQAGYGFVVHGQEIL